MGHPTDTQIKRAIDEGVDKILKELAEIKGRLPAGLHIESGWADEERKKKLDSDWDFNMEFTSSYMGISWNACSKRIYKKSFGIGDWYDRTEC